jgi:cbb3-type cytochrome oxidase subunit 1
MNDADPPKLKIPLDWVIVDAIGALVAALGVLGLTGGGESLHPLLANRTVAGLLLVAGMALMAVALMKILQRMRASARAPRR